MISFTLPIVPFTATHHDKKIGRVRYKGKDGTQHDHVRLIDKPDLVTARHTYEALMLPYRPAAPWKGPVCLTLDFAWPWQRRALKRDIAKGWAYKTTKPDLTNLEKTIEDCLARCGFVLNDSQICVKNSTKVFSEVGFITVKLMQLGGQHD